MNAPLNVCDAEQWWHNYLEAIVPGMQWWVTVHPVNQRSIRLLMRLAYQEIDPSDRPNLQSYGPGDRCFVRSESWPI